MELIALSSKASYSVGAYTKHLWRFGMGAGNQRSYVAAGACIKCKFENIDPGDINNKHGI